MLITSDNICHIKSYALPLVKPINNSFQINVPPYPSQTAPSSGMSGPRRLARNQLPDPWLLDSGRLLQELARIREIALRIPPVRNDIFGPINSVIDAVWDLEQRLRYCLHLHCETQRAFRKQHEKAAGKSQPARRALQTAAQISKSAMAGIAKTSLRIAPT